MAVTPSHLLGMCSLQWRRKMQGFVGANSIVDSERSSHSCLLSIVFEGMAARLAPLTPTPLPYATNNNTVAIIACPLRNIFVSWTKIFLT